MKMKHIRQNWKTYAFWIVLAQAVGGLSGWLTREGAKVYQSSVAQPPLSPQAAKLYEVFKKLSLRERFPAGSAFSFYAARFQWYSRLSQSFPAATPSVKPEPEKRGVG